MPERRTRHGAPWTVTVVPAGTPAEAELAAERARRLVAGWLFTGIVGRAAEEEAGATTEAGAATEAAVTTEAAQPCP